MRLKILFFFIIYIYICVYIYIIFFFFFFKCINGNRTESELLKLKYENPLVDAWRKVSWIVNRRILLLSHRRDCENEIKENNITNNKLAHEE